MELVTAPTVISIDPGGITGWSVMMVHPDALVEADVSILANLDEPFGRRENGQVTAMPKAAKFKARELSAEERQCVRTLYNDVILRWPGAAIVIEDFILRKQSMDRAMLSPVRLTAALEWVIDESGIPYSLFRQTPAEAKGLATDERLKKWGLYQRAGGMQHARDADRHGITFLRKAKQVGGVRAEAWPHLFNADGSAKNYVAA
jgi:hypothetical protein